jgi:sensor histidine kinase regulating citrate/malate metabolism
MLKLQLKLQEQQTMETSLSTARDQYALLAQKDAQERKIRHDMKYHMQVIYDLLEQKQYEELSRYLESYYSTNFERDGQFPAFSHNYTVNILASHYARKAEFHRIRIDFKLTLPEKLPIDDPQLSVLFGNLWQNALDACIALPEEMDRFVETSAGFQQDKLMIHCKNSSPRVICDAEGTFISNKGKEHGVGLSSIRYLVSMHQGYCNFSYTEGVFTASLLLPLSQQTLYKERMEGSYVKNCDL